VDRGRIRRARGRHGSGLELGVQFSLSLIALKALPVVILGGFNLGARRDHRRPDHRRREKFAEVFLSRSR